MKIRSPLLTRLAAWIAVQVGRLLFWTLQRDYRDSVRGCCEPDPEGYFIYVTWHDTLILPAFVAPGYNVAALISRHQDGSYLADALRFLNMKPIRGSSSRGGAQAVRQILDEAGSRHVIITPDGPRGPRRRLKPGAVYLASQTGMPLIVCAAAAANAWSIRGSWTDLVIPKPFSRIVIRCSSPMQIPPNLSRSQLLEFMEQVQQTADETYAMCERLAAENGDASAAAIPAQRNAA